MMQARVEAVMAEESESELRERIEATRARMGETIEEIGDRVHPDRVKSELKAHAREQVQDLKDNVKMKARSTMRDVKHEVRDTGRGIWQTIRENPVPAGMVGIGLAWLLVNRDDSRDFDRDYGYDARGGMGPAVPYRPGMDRDFSTMDQGSRYTGGVYSAGSPYGNRYGSQYGGQYGGQSATDAARGAAHGAADSIRDTAEHLRDTAQDGLEAARDRVEDAVDTVRHAAGSAAETVRDTASEAVHRAADGIDHVQDRVSDMAEQARYRAVRVEQRVEYAARDNPLAAGAVAMALGLMTGLLIPETRREHRLMGRTRDDLMDRAGEFTQRATERVRDVAHDAVDSVKEVVEDALPDDGGSESGRPSQMRG
jgi:ElaB/YqjD/DUF883 family membrane-anchored ribosome-binding protein